MTTQRCPFCAKRVTYDPGAKVGTSLSCADGHVAVLARCPAGICPTGRIVVDPNIPAKARRRHGACMCDLEVVSSGPPAPTLRLVKS